MTGLGGGDGCLILVLEHHSGGLREMHHVEVSEEGVRLLSLYSIARP